MGSTWFGLMRRQKLTEGLDIDFPEQRSRRGPRTALSDAQLHTRRDQLVQIFEWAWGEIGWELGRCKKTDDLIRVFSPLVVSPGWVRDVMSLFCRPSSEAGAGATLRKVRREWQALAGPVGVAHESKRRAEETLQQVNWALTQAKSQNGRLVRRERKKRRKELWRAVQEHRTLSENERRLEIRLKNLESSFARQELLKFLKSKRYELTPLHLANAAAGLPGVGWRQSMRRTVKTPSAIGDGLAYQVFKSIRYLAASANKKTEDSLVADFRAGVPLLPNRYQQAKVELAERWLYIERAIRLAFRTRSHEKSLHFEITKRYFKQIQSQSQVDRVLAEQARLKLSKRPRV